MRREFSMSRPSRFSLRDAIAQAIQMARTQALRSSRGWLPGGMRSPSPYTRALCDAIEDSEVLVPESMTVL